MQYPREQWTAAEASALTPFVSNLYQPVFALHGLPDVVCGALFARYSRYGGSLRRLLLDEFLPHLGEQAAQSAVNTGAADALYERIFLGYGDDSVAQLGGAHIACEYTSNLLTKILQRPRVAAYLEQSTRYIPFDQPMPNGQWRYFQEASWGLPYQQAMNQLFVQYSALIPQTIALLQQEFPQQPEQSDKAYMNALKAKALDLLRGLLPAATLSHMGIYASGQTYERLVMHLLAHPLAEANNYGEMLLQELRTVIPAFMTRVDKPDRGGRWVQHLQTRSQRLADFYQQLDIATEDTQAPPSVQLLHVDGNIEDLLVAELAETSTVNETQMRSAVTKMDSQQQAQAVATLVGDRENRRHGLGRGWERLRYRFEIVSDYGAFRDLQRHRMLTVQWQRLSPCIGADIPPALADSPLASSFESALAVSAGEWERLRQEQGEDTAQYAVCLAYRMRYILDLNAREAMQLIELRSGREGHPSYRAVAQEMHRLIGNVHPPVAAAMQHVDHSTEPRLERLLSEMRNDQR